MLTKENRAILKAMEKATVEIVSRAEAQAYLQGFAACASYVTEEEPENARIFARLGLSETDLASFCRLLPPLPTLRIVQEIVALSKTTELAKQADEPQADA